MSFAAVTASHAASTASWVYSSSLKRAKDPSHTGSPNWVGSFGSAPDLSTPATPNATRTLLQFSV